MQDLDFPGGKIPLTSQMKFISEASEKRLPCYRVLNDDGSLISNSIHDQVCIVRIIIVVYMYFKFKFPRFDTVLLN